MKKFILKSFVLSSLFAACSAVCFTEIASAQPGLQRPQAGSSGSSNLMNLLRNEAVKSELELIDDQMAEIRAIQDEMSQELREKIGQMRGRTDLSPDERRDQYRKIREEMDERRRRSEEQISKVLLPNQLARLRQLDFQSRARRYGDGAIGVLRSEEMLAELGIDEETREKLKKKTEEVLEELKKKVAKLRRDAEQEILSVLPSEARENFRQSVGESFDFSGGRGALSGTPGRPEGRGGRGRDGREDDSDK